MVVTRSRSPHPGWCRTGHTDSGGGSEPLWTRGGRELVFRNVGGVMAATVEPGAGAVGVPVELFSGPYQDSPVEASPRSYDVTPDGQRFLLSRWPPGNTRRHLLVTLGWWPELRARVASG